MELSDYRKDYLETVKTTAAADAEGTVTTFVKVTLDNLVDAEIISDYELCYYSGRAGRKSCRVDAYAFDDYDYSMSLFITDYSGNSDLERLIRTEAHALFEKLHAFVDGSINGKLKKEIEISTPAYDLVERLNHLVNTIRKFRFYILTDREMSESISSFPFGEIHNIPSEYHIWDIKRLYRVLGTGDGHEPVEIDFCDYCSEGLPCIEASDASTDEFKCYLCVISGNILADIYDKYGSRLLEGNVRSFLSTKVAVNKNIRTTIISQDENTGKPLRYRFFAYNNGISATASSVNINATQNGKYITSINNLQIVNGGQTTASLSNARFKDKADLEGVFVQMKLTEITDHDISQKIIPQISRCSNSQNKVSDADFFSNHEFNIRMQQISRRLYAPAVNGAQYETHWFFERVRGQYQQEQAKMTKSEQTKFELQNPKSQVITKTDFAKYRNSWGEYPHYVSMGAQKNFAHFADYIVSLWDKKESSFNEIYYRNTVALGIMFRFVDKMVSKQSWYDKGYKANIVTYSLALLHYLIREYFPGKILNLKLIWDKQRLPDELEAELIKIAKFIFEYITADTRLISNVTEWCKKEQCWITLKTKEYSLSVNISSCLMDAEEAKIESKEGKKDQRMVVGIEAQTEVVSMSQDYWENLLFWGKSKNLLSEIDISFIMSATKINYGRIPSEKQSQRILNIRSRMIEEGFKEK
jgi:AIPR protein.